MKAFDLYPHKCKTCGKKFEGGSQYAYKIEIRGSKYIWFCSWHCIREYRKTHKERRKVG